MFQIISTPYKLRKNIPKVWYYSEKCRIFASSQVSINSINNFN
jgi:hypothetical protein